MIRVFFFSFFSICLLLPFSGNCQNSKGLRELFHRSSLALNNSDSEISNKRESWNHPCDTKYDETKLLAYLPDTVQPVQVELDSLVGYWRWVFPEDMDNFRMIYDVKYSFFRLHSDFQDVSSTLDPLYGIGAPIYFYLSNSLDKYFDCKKIGSKKGKYLITKPYSDTNETRVYLFASYCHHIIALYSYDLPWKSEVFCRQNNLPKVRPGTTLNIRDTLPTKPKTPKVR